MSSTAAVRRRVDLGAAEARKLPAFLRRDVLIMLSYRAAFAGELTATTASGRVAPPAAWPAA